MKVEIWERTRSDADENEIDIIQIIVYWEDLPRLKSAKVATQTLLQHTQNQDAPQTHARPAGGMILFWSNPFAQECEKFIPFFVEEELQSQ